MCVWGGWACFDCILYLLVRVLCVGVCVVHIRAACVVCRCEWCVCAGVGGVHVYAQVWVACVQV